MFGLDAHDEHDTDDVPQATSFTTGDHAIDPDGREWVVSDVRKKILGRTCTILEAAEDRSERCAVTSVAAWQQWDVISQDVVGWRCAVCSSRGDEQEKPHECPDCGSVQTRERREWRGGR